jgi:hypothetical protein
MIPFYTNLLVFDLAIQKNSSVILIKIFSKKSNSLTGDSCMNTKNIVFTADNNYMQHLAVTLISLLENNKSETFKIFIFSSDITNANKEKIEQLIAPYHCTV